MGEPGQKLPVTDLECLKEAFALFDRDRNGEINTEELGKVGITMSVAYKPHLNLGSQSSPRSH